MITVASVLLRTRRQLHDPASSRWADAVLLDYLNEGQRQIVITRPEANAVTFLFSLAEGSSQELSDEYIALGEVTCNMFGGFESGVVMEVAKSSLDLSDIDWRSGPLSTSVIQFARSSSIPYQFSVYPPNDGNGVVKVIASKEPVPSTVDGGLSLRNGFESALLHFICSRCFGEDRDSKPSADLSAFHEAQYMKMIGVPGRSGGANAA